MRVPSGTRRCRAARLAGSLCALLLLVVGGGTACWGQAYSSAGAGTWSTPATWTPNGTPGSGDTVSIGHNITLSGGQSIDGITFTASATISGANTLTLGGAATISVATGVTGSITTTIIGGTAGLTKTGSGVLALSAINSYSGTTLVSAGTLRISGANGAINLSTQVTVSDGATLDVDSTSTSTDRFANGGTITMNGGTFSWTGSAAALSETIGTLQFAAKHSVVAFTGNSGTNTVTLNVNSTALTNATSRQNQATMAFQRSNGFLKASLTSAGILRWTSVYDATRSTLAYFTGTYDATNGLVQIAQISGNTYVTNTGGPWNGAGTGTWAVNASNNGPVAGDSVVVNGGSFVGTGSVSQSCCSIFYGASGASINQAGTLVMTGNIYATSPGGFNVTSAMLDFSSGEGVLNVVSGSTFNHYNDAFANTTLFTKTGAGSVTMGNGGGGGPSSGWSNPIAIVQGKVVLNTTVTPLSTCSGVTVYDGGALDMAGFNLGAIPSTINGTGYAGSGALMDSSTTACTYAGSIFLTSDSSIEVVSGGSMTLSNAIGGFFSLTKTDPGQLILSNTNTWTGSLTISDGAVRVTGGTAIPDACAVTIANLSTASLDLNGANEAIGSLAGGGASGGNVTLAGGTLTVGGTTSTSFDGQITGAGGLTRSSTGTLTLTRASPSFSGTLTASGGELDVNAAYSTGSASITVTGILGGTGAVGAITSAAGCTGAIIRPGSASTKGTLRAGSVNLGTGTNPTVSLRVAAFTTAGTDYDKLDLATNSGTLTCGGTSKLSIDLTGCASAGVATGAITCSGFPGVFSSVAVANAPAGYTAYPRYTTGRVDVVVSSGFTVWNNGAATGLWSNAGNWSNGLPDATHVALFNSTSTAACSIDVSPTSTWLGIDVDSGYSGTITQGSGKTIVLGANGFVQNAGTFNLGAASTDQLVTPFFDQGGGTFGGSGTVMLVASSSQGFTAVSTLPNLTVESTAEYGLVGYWKIDGTNTSGSEADYSGLNRTAALTCNSGTFPSSTNHPATLSFYDPGSRPFLQSDRRYLLITNGGLFDFTGPFTVAAWTQTSQDATFQNYIVYNGSNPGWHLALQTNDAPRFVCGGTQVTAPSITRNGATWTHLAGVWDGTNIKLYVNGSGSVWTGACTAAPGTSGHSLDIGSDASANASTGQIDDVRIYNRALTAAEIDDIAVKGGYGPGRGASVTTTLGRALAVSGDLVLLAGGLDASTANHAVSVGKNLKLYGDFTARAGTVTLNGTASSTLHGGGNRFYDLAVVSTGAGTWTLDDHLWVDDVLTVTTGTLNVSASNWSIHAGTVAQGGGTITPQSGTVVVDGSTSANLAVTSTLKHLQVADPKETSLVAYWPLDEGAGSSARERSGNGLTATLTNGATWSTSVPAAMQAQDGFALSLDGVDDYVTVTDPGAGSVLDFASGSTITIAAWVYAADTTTYHTILTKGRTTTGGDVANYALRVNTGGTLEFYYTSGATNWQVFSTAAGAVAAGSWHHVAVTYTYASPSTALLYVDGAQIAGSWTTGSGSGAPSVGDEPLWIGACTYTGSVAPRELWTGQIDDVRIYTTALDGPHVRLLAAGKHANTASSTHTLTNALTLTGDLYLLGGTLAANTFGINVAGNWRNLVGTSAFTAGSGTVTMNGTNQQLFGSTNFFNLTKSVGSADTLSFPPYETQGITGALALNGASGQLLSIRSSTSGSQAAINPTGTRACTYLSVKDARNLTMPFIIPRADATCVNAGNTRWWFETVGAQAGNVLIGSPNVE